MSHRDWRRVSEIIDAVVSALPSDRQRILLEQCGGDASLESEVASLLKAHEARSFLDESSGWQVRPGDVLCDRFVVARAIGQGGMGEVWAAADRQLGEEIAIKTIRTSAVPTFPEIDRFKREIQLARRIAHPNVCRVHELFEDRSGPSPRLLLTMELIEGETLAERLRREGAIPIDEAMAIVQQVIAGLAAAHDVNVVHRDLKPSNVMLTPRAQRRVVLMDFGLARVFDPASTGDTTRSAVTAVIGTPQYMAPEQISGSAPTARTDIYALGLMLYEVLRGERPFGGGTLESWLRRAREKPPRLSGVVPGVTQPIDDAIARCLEYDPGSRFESVGEVWEALGRRRFPFVYRKSVQLAAGTAVFGIASAVWFAGRPDSSVPGADAVRAHADAVRELAEGASVRALNSVSHALELSPQYTAAQALRAEILLELDMPGRAQEAMLMAAGSDQKSADADYITGIRELVLRNCEAAMPPLRRYGQTGAPADQPYRMLSLARGLERCGRPNEANDVLVKAAALDPRNAAVLVRQARLFALRPDYAKAEEALARAEVLFRERTNYEGVCEVLVARGTYQAAGENTKDAAETLMKAREMAVSLSDVRQQVRVGLQMAIVSRKRGNVAAAEQLTTEAVDLARRHSLEPLTLEGLLGNGNVHLVRNQFPQALALFEQARAIAETNRHEQYLARSNLTLASVYVRAMEPDKAEKSLSAARPYFERAGQTRNLAAVDILQGEVLGIQAAYPAALTRFTTALAAAERASDRDQEIRTRENIATTLSSMGRYPEALAEYQRVLALHQRVGRTRSESFTLLNISDTQSRMGRFEESAAAMREAALGIPDAAEIQATMCWVRADNAIRQGQEAAALSNALRSIEVGAGLSIEREVRAHLIACTAAARLGQTADALRHCGVVRAVDGLQRNKRLWLEVQVVDAEVKLVLGDSIGAAKQVEAALSDLEATQSNADRWRLLAILTAAAHGSARAEWREQLSRELAALRSLWGESVYQSWSQRADVRSLMAMMR